MIGVKGSDTSVYVLLYMLVRGESEVTGSASVCAGRAQTSAKSILDENRKAVVES